eukprot:7001088-Prorocentrum_lima.AAC.1
MINLDNVVRNPTTKRSWGKEHEMSAAVFHELHKFFEPFNDMLYELIGRKLPWGADRFRAKYDFG